MYILYVCTYVCMCGYVYTHIYIDLCTHVYICMYVRMYVCIRTFVYIYRYIYGHVISNFGVQAIDNDHGTLR